ncbi:pyruvate kinase [Endothiovibrio diazotrophicus]
MSPRAEVRKTKIVATVGPACDTPETLHAMMAAGMNVVRLNLSHGSYEDHRERLERVRAVAKEGGFNVAAMVDTRGIEIRSGRLEGGTVELIAGRSFTLYSDGRVGNEEGCSVSNRELPRQVAAGTPILLDDGAMELVVTAVDGGQIHCRVIHGGLLKENKGVNLPETELEVSEEYQRDVQNELEFASENDVDYLAASFVQTAEDIRNMRAIMARWERRIPIIAKIENKAGMAHLEEIVDAADGIMVARGDLGVELPLADVPGKQKQIIRTTVSRGKPVITATEMLASMERNPRPTRAEASDVANAILDGTSAVMLSGETAAGRYPLEAVETMATLARRAEASLREYGYLQRIPHNPSNGVTEAVAQAAVNMAGSLDAAAIFSLSTTGFTSRLISKHRPECPIISVTSSRLVSRRLAMNWGVIPFLYQGEASDEARIEFGLAKARALGYLAPGDVVVCTSGYRQQAGGTDLLRVITLGS